MDVRAKVEELLAIDAQVAALDERRKRLRAELAEEALRRYHDEGAAPSWKVKGLGTVALACPEPVPTFDDGVAFTAWVAEHSPTEVIPTVRPSYVKALGARSRFIDGRLVTDDGEVVPGVAPMERDPYLTVRLDRDAKAAAVAAATQETPR